MGTEEITQDSGFAEGFGKNKVLTGSVCNVIKPQAETGSSWSGRTWQRKWGKAHTMSEKIRGDPQMTSNPRKHLPATQPAETFY